MGFEKTEVPAVAFTREAKPNPYIDTVVELNKDRGTAITDTFPNADAKAVAKALQAAGKSVGCTVRVKREDAGDDRTKITAWAVNRVTRAAKPKTAEKPSAKK